MSAESKPLTHPGTWLPGDRVTSTSGSAWVWECAADGGWPVVSPENRFGHLPADRIEHYLATGGVTITHLVPRPEPTPASSEDARRMLAARQEGDDDEQVKRLRAAAETERRAERHWAADCLLEAADTIVRLRAMLPDDDEEDAEPEPVPEWTKIPEGRENAQVLEVNGVVGTYWRDPAFTRGVRILTADPEVPDGEPALFDSHVTSVVPVRVLGDDQVAVERTLVKRAREIEAADYNSQADRCAIVHDLAALLDGEASDD